MFSFLYIPFPDWFENTDRRLFELINTQSANNFFDWLMPLLRNTYIWAPLYIFMAVFVIMNFRKKGWWWILLFLITVSCTDWIGTNLFKEIFERLRPCSDPAMAGHIRRVLGRCSGGFSFVSNHAINHFGMATFFYITFKSFFQYTGFIFIWAALISIAQVYVGVHYPFDILAGALLGIIIGTVTGRIFNKRYGFHIFDKESTIN